MFMPVASRSGAIWVYFPASGEFVMCDAARKRLAVATIVLTLIGSVGCRDDASSTAVRRHDPPGSSPNRSCLARKRRVDAAQRPAVGQIRGDRRQRPRFDCRNTKWPRKWSVSREVQVCLRVDARRQHLRRSGERPRLREEFEAPYRALLDDDVKFFAVLGNHDDPRQVHYGCSTWTANAITVSRRPKISLTRVNTSVEFFVSIPRVDRVQLDGSTSGCRIGLRTGRLCSCIIRSTHRADTATRPRALRGPLEPMFVARGPSMSCSRATSTSTSALSCSRAFSTS